MRTPCPLCEHTDVVSEYSVTANEAAQHWFLAEEQPETHRKLARHIRLLWSQDHCDAMLCNHCGFGFASPFVAGDAPFYEIAFGQSGYLKDKWEFQQTIAALSKMDFSDSRILEVGSGYGYFLDHLSPRFVKPDNITALEYNPTAMERLRSKGYGVEQTDVLDMAQRGDRYRAVFMFQVLEHRDRPHDTFSALSQMIEPGGHLFIAVPNPLSTQFSERHGSLLDMPPNHIGRWTLENLRSFGDQYGFDTRDAVVEPFSPGDFIRTDMIFSFMRSAQKGSFPANWLYARRQTSLGKFATALGVAAYAPRRIPIWLKARAKSDHLGLHHWIHLARR